MFKSMKSRWWLLRIAEHEMYSALMKTDQKTIRDVTRQFESEMRKEKSWPFNSPEELALSFSAWLGRNPDLCRQLQITPSDIIR